MTTSKLKKFFFLIICGFFLGTSVIAPGVSGSVMAVMMGIYRDLINIISNPFKRFKRNVIYILPLAIGALAALALGVAALSRLFDNYPTQSRILFMGLVAGGLPSMLVRARLDGNGKKMKIKPIFIILMVFAMLIAGGVGVFARTSGATVGDSAPLLYLCLAGAVAGASSMMPGMSVSLILMLFGVYEYLMNIASDLVEAFIKMDIFWGSINLFVIVAAVTASFVMGMISFSKLTKFVFERYSGIAYFMVFGFMCGTLTAICPSFSLFPSSAKGIALCAVMLVIGLFVSILFVALGKKFNAEEIV